MPAMRPACRAGVNSTTRARPLRASIAASMGSSSTCRVRAIQPGPIETPIWGDIPGNEKAAYDGEFFPPEDCAAAILDALTGEGFERYIPESLGDVVKLKAQDVDGFIAGSAAFAANPEAVEHV